MTDKLKSAEELHESVPPDWYYRSIRENLIQRYVHKRRFEEVGRIIEPTGGKLLDIGCADGVFTKVILDKSKADKIIGIDVLKTSINWARKHWKKKRKMIFKIGDAHSLKFENNTFDAVFAIEVLEHVYEPKKVLKEIKRVLKRDGYAIFLVPAESLLFKIVWYFWTKNRGKIWKGTHLHAYSNSYLVELVKNAGFEKIEDNKIIFETLHLVKVRKR